MQAYLFSLTYEDILILQEINEALQMANIIHSERQAPSWTYIMYTSGCVTLDLGA